MILYKNSTNTVVLTLDEKKTISDPIWLIEFTSDMTGEVKTIVATDNSQYRIRYNQFSIIEGSDKPFIGSVILSPSGMWTYRVYESDSSPVDLNAKGKLCEVGICTVIDSTENPFNTFDIDDTKNTKVFDA